MKPYPASFPSTAIFSGMSREEIESILHCLGASQEVFPKGCAIFRAGDETESMGLVLSGNVLVIQEDLWGHRSIMDMIVPEIPSAKFSLPHRAVFSMSAL